MADFTLRQLEYFVAAGEAQSVTLAAERIPISQPSVSAAIAQLERVLGVQLFLRRQGQRLVLTPAGARVLEEGRDLLERAERFERIAWELGEEIRGVLKLGLLVTVAPLVGSAQAAAFAAVHPGVTVEVREDEQDGLLRDLAGGQLDVALTYDLQLGEGVAFEPLVPLPPCALLPADHPLARCATIALDTLAEEPLVLLDLPHSRDYFTDLLAARGLTPSIARRSPHPEVIRALVAEGAGWSIVNARPASNRALDGRELATVPLAGDVRVLSLGLATPAAARRTRLLAAFVEHCRAAIGPELVAGG